MDIYQLLKNMTFREKLAQLTQLDGSFHIAQEDGQPTGPLFAMNITEEMWRRAVRCWGPSVRR